MSLYHDPAHQLFPSCHGKRAQSMECSTTVCGLMRCLAIALAVAATKQGCQTPAVFLACHAPLYSRGRRQAYGNNPDTSKALRFLVAEDRIVRSGLGGRKDPYSYVVSAVPGLCRTVRYLLCTHAVHVVHMHAAGLHVLFVCSCSASVG
jgi:hypothetical protein